MTSPYKTLEEAAVFLRYEKDGQPQIAALRKFLHRQGVILTKRGGRVLIHVDELNKTLTRRSA